VVSTDVRCTHCSTTAADGVYPYAGWGDTDGIPAEEAPMTSSRIAVTLTTLIAAMFALLLIAALVGSGGRAEGTTGGFSDGSSALVPWHKAAPAHPQYARTVYREHHMCDKVHQRATKSPDLNP
jgi:hypothetical protein